MIHILSLATISLKWPGIANIKWTQISLEVNIVAAHAMVPIRPQAITNKHVISTLSSAQYGVIKQYMAERG